MKDIGKPSWFDAKNNRRAALHVIHIEGENKVLGIEKSLRALATLPLGKSWIVFKFGACVCGFSLVKDRLRNNGTT